MNYLRKKMHVAIGAVSLMPLTLALMVGASTPAIAPTKAEALVVKPLSQTWKVKTLAKYANAHYLSDRDLVSLLSAVGFKGQDLREAWAVAKKETNGRPLAHNGNHKTGDNSYGIFQINMLGDLGPIRREQFGLKSNSDLLNPVVNAQIAYHMSNGGKNWSAWKGMTARTKYWLKKFPQTKA